MGLSTLMRVSRVAQRCKERHTKERETLMPERMESELETEPERVPDHQEDEDHSLLHAGCLSSGEASRADQQTSWWRR
jgi:hypothetical protein